MEVHLVKLESYLQRLTSFGTNTKKMSKARLSTNLQVANRRKLLCEYWSAFEEEHFRILVECSAEGKEYLKLPYFAKNEYVNAEQAYQDACNELDELTIANTPSASTDIDLNATIRTESVQVQPAIRMVPITPPTFSGDVTQWTSFRDLFQAVVISNVSLSPVQRLQYLKMACKGEAEELLRDIAVTDANFTVAWAELVKRFENKRVTVSKLVDKLLTVKGMNSESAIELKGVLDGTNQALRSLKAMDRPTEHWGDIIVTHTVRKLDCVTRKNWERHISSTNEMPTFEQLDEFLVKELRSMEAMCDVVGSAVQMDAKKKVVRTHFVDTKPACVLCKGTHGIYLCDKFLALSVEERRKVVDKERLCFNCISTNRHVSRDCKSTYVCKECRRRHHTLLHETVEVPVASHVVNSKDGFNVLLATAIIQIKAANGKGMQVRVLIDPGSHASFVTEDVVQQLGCSRTRSDVNVIGVGEASAGRCGESVELQLFDRAGKGSVFVNALIMKRITSKLPAIKSESSQWAHLQGLQLADNKYAYPDRIDMLLGADVYPRLMLGGVRNGAIGPLAQETIFGWVLTGQIAVDDKEASTVLALHINLDDQLKRFWEVEEIEAERASSMDDKAAEQIFRETTKREVDGRYTLQFPFRTTSKTLGESREMAVKRLLQMERRFASKEDLYQQYTKFMDSYLELGHMECVLQNSTPTIQEPVYLPHHAVLKPTSTTTKLRVVFDASQKTSTGCSLNETLLTGPRLQDDLAAILVRWRQHKIALSADVEKMYRQIWIAKQHRDYQRIVWRRTPNEPIKDYRLKTITYGTASAPYMAVRAMQLLADDERDSYPRAAVVVKQDFYMDDCLTGADNVDDAIRLKEELLGLMQAGGLRLLKWSSNSREVMLSLPEDHRECRTMLNIEDDDTIKTLGVHWHPSTDQFGYRVTLSSLEGTLTKRKILSDIARLFDPLSLLAPVIVTAKVMLQQLWLTGRGWDDELPKELVDQWAEFRRELQCVEAIRINRWTGVQEGVVFEIHGFSDASKVAYAACVYVRTTDRQGVVKTTLVVAKSKVAPIKQISIPRLELSGALLLSRLLGAVRKALHLPKTIRVLAWTDSTVVLAWIRGHANRWPTFVANRVSIIQDEQREWRHVPGIDNPADVASRGTMPSCMANHQLWWNGPQWLRENEEEWPAQIEQQIDPELLEEKSNIFVGAAHVSSVWNLVNTYSSLNRLLRVTAYCKRVFQQKSKVVGELTAKEIRTALTFWITHVQGVAFPTKTRTSKLKGLNAFEDNEGVLRVGGRLQNATCSYNERHPIILPKKGAFTYLVIADAHATVMHYGPKQTMAQLQQQYWILGVRNAVKAYTRRCVTCCRARPITHHQLMGSLPASRVTPARAFLHTAIDYAGPIWTRTSKGRGHKANKAWIAVFICLASKATHLELVSDLTTDGFLAAFRRFTARRGHCSDVYCDNGTNFVGAAGELERNLQACLRDEAWGRQLCKDGSKFHFAPPGSPHFNGLAEAAVKIAKSALRKIIGEHTLTFEEMATFLAQVESIMNSRPIQPLTRDPEDLAMLTPGHLLIGQPLTAVPEPNLLNIRESSLSRWKLVQRLTQQFWSRWSKEYLHTMQQRDKWQTTQKEIAIGDMVLVRDEGQPTMKWKLGRIADIHPGDDGIVRVVTVQTAESKLKRSIVKICKLPIEPVTDK